MRAVHLRSFSLAAVAVVTLASAVTAEERTSGLLNSLEVRQLVARAEPGDHVRLTAHFTALADRYAAEAKRHVAMALGFGGNPSRNLGGTMSSHCTRLAGLNEQSAATVRELAAYHDTLASGSPAVLPPGGATFQSGAGAREPSESELNALAAKASTPAEHHALEEYFVTLAQRYTAEAGEHAALARRYRGTRTAHAGVHHDRLAGLARDAAKEATKAAEVHKGLAAVRYLT